MPNDTSTKSTTDRKAGAERHDAIGALSVQTTQLRERHSKLTRDEAAMICEVADNIVRYARRRRAEMAAIIAI